MGVFKKQKKSRVLAGLIFFLAGQGFPGAQDFSISPSLTSVDGSAAVTFTVSGATDAEVSIVNSNGKIVAHLAAGYLGGSNPPPDPLKPGFQQTLSWDGKTDLGTTPTGGPFSFRVRLGLKADFDFSVTTTHIPGEHFGGQDINPLEDHIDMKHPFFQRAKIINDPPYLNMAVDDETDELRIRVWHSNWNNHYPFDGNTGDPMEMVNLGTQFRRQVMGEFTFTWDGQHFYNSTGLDEIIRYGRDGKLSNWPGSNASKLIGFPQGFQHSRGIATDKNGNLYIQHHLAHRVWWTSAVARVSPDAKSIKKNLISTAHASVSGGIRVDKAGNIYIGVHVTPYNETVPEFFRKKYPNLKEHFGITNPIESYRDTRCNGFFGNRWCKDGTIIREIRFDGRGMAESF